VTDAHAVILAGGKGTRLRPYTTVFPKPLVPIGDEFSIVEIVLRQLAHRGFRRATLAIGHQGSLIQAVVGDGAQWGLEVDYAEEKRPLGTMGPVRRLLDQLPENFLVLNGDVLTDLDFGAVLRTHATSGAAMTIATYRRQVEVDFGVLEVEDGLLVGFKEKPTLEYSVSMGVYGLSRETLAGYPMDEPLGFDGLVLDLLRAGRAAAVYPFDGYWLDIGRPADYDRANLDFARMRDELLPPA
jgi:NDP-mannose synthase